MEVNNIPKTEGADQIDKAVHCKITDERTNMKLNSIITTNNILSPSHPYDLSLWWIMIKTDMASRNSPNYLEIT